MLSDREVLRFLPLPVPRLKKPATDFRHALFAVADKRSLREPVSSIMQKDPEVAKPADFLSVVVNLLLNGSVGGVAVVDPNSGQLSGLVTSTDILRVIRVTLQMGAILSSPVISDSEWQDVISGETPATSHPEFEHETVGQ